MELKQFTNEILDNIFNTKISVLANERIKEICEDTNYENLQNRQVFQADYSLIFANMRILKLRIRDDPGVKETQGKMKTTCQRLVG